MAIKRETQDVFHVAAKDGFAFRVSETQRIRIPSGGTPVSVPSKFRRVCSYYSPNRLRFVRPSKPSACKSAMESIKPATMDLEPELQVEEVSEADFQKEISETADE